jgi:hypothetical protein
MFLKQEPELKPRTDSLVVADIRLVNQIGIKYIACAEAVVGDDEAPGICGALAGCRFGIAFW